MVSSRLGSQKSLSLCLWLIFCPRCQFWGRWGACEFFGSAWRSCFAWSGRAWRGFSNGPFLIKAATPSRCSASRKWAALPFFCSLGRSPSETVSVGSFPPWSATLSTFNCDTLSFEGAVLLCCCSPSASESPSRVSSNSGLFPPHTCFAVGYRLNFPALHHVFLGQSRPWTLWLWRRNACWTC